MRIILIVDVGPSMKSNAFTTTTRTAAAPGQSAPFAAEPAPANQSGLDSRVLFAGGSEIVIFHYGESYRLRETRQGKLILTK